MDIYKQPITTSHDYGWWIKDGGHAPDWAHTDRHAHVNSEMTRYGICAHELYYIIPFTIL